MTVVVDETLLVGHDDSETSTGLHGTTSLVWDPDVVMAFYPLVYVVQMYMYQFLLTCTYPLPPRQALSNLFTSCHRLRTRMTRDSSL